MTPKEIEATKGRRIYESERKLRLVKEGRATLVDDSRVDQYGIQIIKIKEKPNEVLPNAK